MTRVRRMYVYTANCMNPIYTLFANPEGNRQEKRENYARSMRKVEAALPLFSNAALYRREEREEEDFFVGFSIVRRVSMFTLCYRRT